ncbi:MAG: hypothetical protein U9R58_08220, partial [Chloroflexota bacterium]|nr:hypothetical protein [Chloroflexota bacterium]
MVFRAGFFIAVFLVILSACSPVDNEQRKPASLSPYTWKYADIRALDQDDAQEPEMDLLAVYLRHLEGSVQIRLDFLELRESPNFDLHLFFDKSPKSETCLPVTSYTDLICDAQVSIPAAGDIQLLKSSADGERLEISETAGITIYRDPILDTITITMPSSILTSDVYAQFNGLYDSILPAFDFQVFVTPAGTEQIVDSLPPTRSDAPPPKPASVLLTFWNTYPAYTPALALRRWDGAHTGPLGGRHGLYNLLRTAKAADIPLVLLDLNTPTSLSALDYGSYLGLVQEMVSSGQLILPEALPASNSLPFDPPAGVLEKMHLENQDAANNFDVVSNSFLFSPYGLSPIQEWSQTGTSSQPVFMFIPDTSISNLKSAVDSLTPYLSAVFAWRGMRILPVPGYMDPSINAEQATKEGPSLETKRALIQTAIQTQESSEYAPPNILLLGGELPGSTWGVPQNARATFKYIANHPWIKSLDSYDLITYPVSTSPLTPLSPALLENNSTQKIFNTLLSAPSNILSTAAWQAYMALLAPVYPSLPQLPQLRVHYFGQIGALIAASKWAADPSPGEDCTMDIDFDGQPECILASSTVFAVLEIDTSSITYAFIRTSDGGIHQFIGPSSQFITGLSDPSTWDLSGGLDADPSVITGGFISQQETDQISVLDKALTFTWEDGEILAKTYRLLPDGILVQFSLKDPTDSFNTHLPVVIDPWLRFTPDFSTLYNTSANESQRSLNIASGLSLTLDGSMNFT